jgi:hypothetical protein
MKLDASRVVIVDTTTLLASSVHMHEYNCRLQVYIQPFCLSGIQVSILNTREHEVSTVHLPWEARHSTLVLTLPPSCVERAMAVCS